GCEGSPPGCLRAALAPAGRETLRIALARAGLPPQPELKTAERVCERVDAVDALRLSDERSVSRAIRLQPVFDAPEVPAAPPATGSIDLAQIDAALARLTPIDAINGP